MADIRLARPAAGTVQHIACTPDALFIFDFPAGDGTFSREGDNLVITFDDGGTLTLENFYTAYAGENMPSFSTGGEEITCAAFFTAMDEPELIPSSRSGHAAQGNGNRFHEFGNTGLLGGLERLGGPERIDRPEQDREYDDAEPVLHGTIVVKDIPVGARPALFLSTDKGRVQEAGVEGCETPVDSTDPGNPNAEVTGVDSTSGRIVLTDSDGNVLTLSVSGTVLHTNAHSGPATPSVTA